MAETLVPQRVCDLCDHLRLYNIPAQIRHRIQLDKEPLKEYDHCERCEKALAWVLDYLREHGQEVTLPPPPKPTQPKAKTVRADPPKEPEAPAKKAKHYIVCPLSHPSQKGGGSRRITYKGRNTHAPACHDGTKIWEIAWEDPDGILKHPCTHHAECMKTGLAFTSATGLAQHRIACPLPRIDIEAPDE